MAGIMFAIQVRGLIEAAVAEIGEAQHALEQFRSYVQVAQRTEASARLHEFETLHASLKAEASLVEESAQRYVELEKSMTEVPAEGGRLKPSGAACANSGRRGRTPSAKMQTPEAGRVTAWVILQ